MVPSTGCEQVAADALCTPAAIHAENYFTDNILYILLILPKKSLKIDKLDSSDRLLMQFANGDQ